tara:strand:+ start:74 stop:532 length:459 start_codon:yes stop_codon:yes gene_type:complete
MTEIADMLEVGPITSLVQAMARDAVCASREYREGVEGRARYYAWAAYDQLSELGWSEPAHREPMPELANTLRLLAERIAPARAREPDDESPVLTPREAADYLGLGKLGVRQPAERVRYLVKRKRLRSINVLGRTAFQRSDLDEYLIKYTGRS